MHRWNQTAIAALAFALASQCEAANRKTTLHLTFSQPRVGAATWIQGTVGVKHGTVAVHPWLHDRADTLDGNAFKVRGNGRKTNSGNSGWYGSRSPKHAISTSSWPACHHKDSPTGST